jgi:hypothetical protein
VLWGWLLLYYTQSRTRRALLEVLLFQNLASRRHIHGAIRPAHHKLHRRCSLKRHYPQLSPALGVRLTCRVSRMGRGRRMFYVSTEPHYGTLRKLARVLDIEAAELLED